MSDVPGLNRDTVQRRLRAMREHVDELGRLGEVTPERLRRDWMVRAAAERVLIQLVELAVQINTHIVSAAGKLPPSGYRDSFAAATEIGAFSLRWQTRSRHPRDSATSWFITTSTRT